MKDWVGLITAIIQLLTAVKLYSNSGRKKTKKKGTNKRRGRRRR